MALFNVIQPCVVGNLHHTRPTAQPIEVDDDTAAPLVEAGCLEPYRPGHVEHVHVATEPTGGVFAAPTLPVQMAEPYESADDAGREAAERFAAEVVQAPAPKRRNRTRPEA